MPQLRNRLLLPLAALLVVLASAPAAHAGQASVAGGVLTYTDNPGESRSLTWARDGDAFAIHESVLSGGKVSGSAGSGCVMDQRNEVSATYVCSAAGISAVRIELGDGDDFAEANSTSAFAPARYFQDVGFPVTVLGGDGNDEMTGGPLDDVLDGGEGDDLLIGNRDARYGGGDTDDQPATDAMSGGGGSDTISGGKTIDGGGGDDMITGTRFGATIAGGPGKDTIQGGKGDDMIDAGDGADTVDTGDGTNKVLGGEGDDTLRGGEGSEDIDAGDGADTVDGHIGADRVAGGAGNDKLDGGPGADSVSGGAGNDTISASDGDKDLIDCGADVDTVTGWDRGKDKASPRPSCEHVPLGGLTIKGSTVLGYVRGAKTGKLKVRFRCVDCESLKVRLTGWQFFNIPKTPGFAIGANCRMGKYLELKRTTLDQFDGAIPLTKCQRDNLGDHARLEWRGKAKLRRFEFDFVSSGGSHGIIDTSGKR